MKIITTTMTINKNKDKSAEGNNDGIDSDDTSGDHNDTNDNGYDSHDGIES